METSGGEKFKTEKLYPVERSEILEHFRTIETTERSDGGHETHSKEHNQMTLEETSLCEVTRKATNEEMMAIMNAQFYGFDEFQLGKEINIQDVEKLEIQYNKSKDPENKKIVKSEQYCQEQIIEGPRIVDVTEQFKATSKSEKSNLQQTILIEDESGLNVSTDTNQLDDSHLHIETLTPDYENVAALNSLHRIRHKRHVLEEIVLEDVDTFYEDKTKKRFTLTKSVHLDSLPELNNENYFEGNINYREKNAKRLKIDKDKGISKDSNIPDKSFTKTFVVNSDLPWVNASYPIDTKVKFDKSDEKINIDETKTFIIKTTDHKLNEASKFNPQLSSSKVDKNDKTDETKTFIINYDSLVGQDNLKKLSSQKQQYFIEHDKYKIEHLNPKQIETLVTQVSYIIDNGGSSSSSHNISSPNIDQSYLIHYDDYSQSEINKKLNVTLPSTDTTSNESKIKDLDKSITYQIDYSNEFKDSSKFETKSKPGIFSKKRKYDVQGETNQNTNFTYVVNYDELPRSKMSSKKIDKEKKLHEGEFSTDELKYVINYDENPFKNVKDEKFMEKDPKTLKDIYVKSSEKYVAKDIIDDLPIVVTENNPFSQKELYLDDSTNVVYEESKYKFNSLNLKQQKKALKPKSDEIFIDEDINIFTDVRKEIKFTTPKSKLDIDMEKYYAQNLELENEKIKTYIIEHDDATQAISPIDLAKIIINYDDQQIQEPLSEKKIKDISINKDKDNKRKFNEEIQMSQTYIIEHPTIIKPPSQFNEKSHKKNKKSKSKHTISDADESKTYVINYYDQIKKSTNSQLTPIDLKSFVVQHDDYDNSLPRLKKSNSEIKQAYQDNSVFTVVEDNPRRSLIMSSHFGQAEIICSDDIDMPSSPQSSSKQLDNKTIIIEHQESSNLPKISELTDSNLMVVSNVTYVVQHNEIDDLYNASLNKKEKSTDCDSALIPLLCVHG